MNTATLRTTVAIPATSMREARLDAMHYRWRQLNSSVDLSKVQSVDQRMRLGMRCRLSPTADVPSHTSGAAMCQIASSVLRTGLFGQPRFPKTLNKQLCV